MNVLTLDEVILHCKAAEEHERTEAAINYDAVDFDKSINCIKCAEEHRQLAEWLERLKAFEEAYEEIKGFPLVWEEGQGIKKCIDLIEKKLKGVNR